MPALTFRGYAEIVRCTWEVSKCMTAFSEGPPKPFEHAVYHDRLSGKRTGVVVVEWYRSKARVQFPGTHGSKALGRKREPPYDMVVRKRDLKRLVPSLTAPELDYIADRAGIVGSGAFRRSQAHFELAWSRRVFPPTRAPERENRAALLRGP